MIRFLLFRAWPALIPVILYLLWIAYRRRKAKQNGHAPVRWRDGPWIAALAASVAILALCFLTLGMQSKPNAGRDYQPMEYIDGELKPGSLQ